MKTILNNVVSFYNIGQSYSKSNKKPYLCRENLTNCNFSKETTNRMERMMIDKNTGLVLEGGGMRGVFTSGVLDAFMQHGLFFNYIVAVSAGACNGMSYMSRQQGRARYSNIDMLIKYDYIGLRHLLRHGSIFDPELLYERFPNEIIPYDYPTY